MAAFTSKSSGNWTATGQTTWNEVGVPGAGDTVSVATSHAITLDQTGPASLTCVSITIAGTGTLVIPAATTFTINADIINNGTATSGAIVVGTGQGVVVNGQITNTAAGYCIVSSGNAPVTATKAGGTACLCSGSSAGRCISHASTGDLAITGHISSTASGACRVVYVNANCTTSITGDLTHNTNSSTFKYVFYQDASGVGTTTITGDLTTAGYGSAAIFAAGTIIINGNVADTYTGGPNGTAAVTISAAASVTWNGTFLDSTLPGFYVIGTLTWTGNRTIAENVSGYIYVAAGTLVLATASDALALTLSGELVVIKVASSGSVTTTNGAYTASVVVQSASAKAAFTGYARAANAIITGPTLPAAADVQAGAADYGYAGGLLDPSYPTTATTQAADVAAIEAAALDTDGTDSTITLPNAVTATAGTALVYAAGEAAQLAADQAAVSAASDNIDGGVSIIGVEGTGMTTDTLRTALGLEVGETVSTFNAASDAVANVTLVDVVTALTAEERQAIADRMTKGII